MLGGRVVHDSSGVAWLVGIASTADKEQIQQADIQAVSNSIGAFGGSVRSTNKIISEVVDGVMCKDYQRTFSYVPLFVGGAGMVKARYSVKSQFADREIFVSVAALPMSKCQRIK